MCIHIKLSVTNFLLFAGQKPVTVRNRCYNSNTYTYISIYYVTTMMYVYYLETLSNEMSLWCEIALLQEIIFTAHIYCFERSIQSVF